MNALSGDTLLECMCRSCIMQANLADMATKIEAVIFDATLLKAFHYHNSIQLHMIPNSQVKENRQCQYDGSFCLHVGEMSGDTVEQRLMTKKTSRS